MSNDPLDKMAENARELGLDYEPAQRTWVGLTDEEIHNIWLHMSGKSEGLLEAGGKADFPVLFTNAILEFNKRKWVGLTDEEIDKAWRSVDYTVPWEQHRIDVARAIEVKLREKNT